MTINFSNHVMEAMGFRDLGANETVVASFSSVTIYEARGITVPEGNTERLIARVAGAEYRLAVSSSVNDGCRALVQDDFADVEEDWRKEVKSRGPFVLINVGPTDEHHCVSGKMKNEADGSITTYNCFPQARDELAKLEQRILPPVVAAVTCVMNEPGHFVALRRLDRASTGRTANGTQVRDIRMELRAEGYTSYALPKLTLTEKLRNATTLAPTLNPRSARFFSLGLAEEDQLKRFIYFFLALEVETHAVFSRIDHQAKTVNLIANTGQLTESATGLVKNQVESLKNLFDRFVWCAICVWTDLNDSDISEFKALKEARDAIAHGRATDPPAGFARTAELLAQKLINR